MLVVSHVFLEPRHVEPQRASVAMKVHFGRRMATSVDAPVHVPKPPLRARSLHRFGRQHRDRVSIDDREVTHDDEQLVTEVLAHASDGHARRLT